MKVKIVINDCYGGFNLSESALRMLGEMGVKDADRLPRHDSRLVEVIERLGRAASGFCSSLVVVEEELPSGRYRIDEYDGA